MFISWQPDFRRLLYLSFSTNIQILCGGLDAPGSDPPHKIMQYWFYHSSLLADAFSPDENGREKIFVPIRYQLPKGTSAGLALEYFNVLYRVGQYIYIHTYINTYMYIYIYIHIYVYIYELAKHSKGVTPFLLPCVQIYRYTYVHV